MRTNKVYLGLAVFVGLAGLAIIFYLVACVDRVFQILALPLGLCIGFLLDKAGVI